MASGKGASDSQSAGPRFKSYSGAYRSFRYKVFSLQVSNYGKKKDLGRISRKYPQHKLKV